MICCRNYLLLSVLLLSWRTSDAFTSTHYFAHNPQRSRLHADQSVSSTAEEQVSADSDGSDGGSLGLTPELQRLTDAFEAIGDDKLRYKQLLYMANQLQAMDESKKIPENQVPGCLSTVHVDATVDGDEKIVFVGDSDGLLTKGLVALLVRGLSGNSAEAIQKVDPSFIQKAGIAASLTPGRNNGFLNMLAVMKKRATEVESGNTAAESADQAESGKSSSEVASTGRPMYDAIVANLQKLQPVALELTDNSQQHAGHTEAPGGESHFDLAIVSEAFDGLNLVKRHQLVYMMLGEVMPKIHALQIRAQTPEEAGM